MFITLGEAAGQSGLSKSTLSRAIRDGKISAERSADTKSYRIEAAELQRYLDATAVLRASTTAPESHSATPLEQPLSAARKAQIEGLKQVAETLLQRQLDDALELWEKWESAFQQQARLALLTPQPAAPTTPRRKWWPWRRAG